MPAVSIVVPVYNSERFITETLESVCTQTFRDFEVVVVDDGSTDGTKDIVDRFVSRDSRFRYTHQENTGVSAARNAGFELSSGDLIAFLDSDDIWLDNNLKLKVELLGRESDIGLVHSDALVIDEHSRKTDTVLSGAEGQLLDGLLLWQGTQIPGPSSILVKRTVLETVGLFDEKLTTAADKDLFIRIAVRFKVGRVNEITWQYRMHAANMHKNISAMETDTLLLYEKAREMNLFPDSAFENKCFAATYLILAASWAGDGKNIHRGFLFLLRAIRKDPSVIFDVTRRIFKRWV